MTRRLVIGRRSNGDKGVFISPSGVDAYTAADSSLILGIGGAIAQLVMQGQVTSSTTIPLGFSHEPFVFITAKDDLHLGLVNLDGSVCRPAPQPRMVHDDDDDTWSTVVRPSSTVTINSGGASMSISAGLTTIYQVYNKAFA